MTNKRGIVALLLVMCFVLTAVPAFAATWEVTIEPVEKIVIPEEGITVAGNGSGAATKLGGKSGIAIVLAKGEENKLGIQDAKNLNVSDLNGILLSGAVTYKKSALDGDNGNPLLAFTIENVPVEAVRASSNGALCLEISRDNIIANSPELESVDQFGKEFGAFNMAQVTITPGSWKAPTAIVYQSDDFPAGTIFLSAKNFTVSAGSKESPGWGNYYLLNTVSGKLSATGGFVPKESGEYEIWMLTSSHGGTTSNRTPTLKVGDTTATIPTDTTPYGNTQMIWAKSNATVTLTANAGVGVMLSNGSSAYARFAGAALVPVNAENKPTANFATKSGDEGRISSDMLVQLEQMTTVQLQLDAGPDVSVTVDGKAVQAKVWSGISMGSTDAAGVSIVNPTVADALAVAGKTAPSSGRMLVYMDGVLVINPNVTYVKKGAAITTEVKTDGFKPVAFSVSMAQNSTGGLYQENNNVRVMMKKAHFDSAFSDYATQLKDARLAGVLYPRDITGEAKFGTTNGHVVFRAKPLVRMVVDYNTTYHEAVYEGIKATSNSTGKEESPDVTLAKDENGSTLGIRSDIVHYDPWFYCAKDLYVVDKYTTGGVYVLDNGDHKLVTVDGADDLYIVTATYDENGNLVDTSVQTQVVTTNEPFAVKVADNQKVYIWRNQNYLGTTMEPLCAPITK